MRALTQLHSKKDAIASIGREARANARSRGIASYYIDPDHPQGIVEERPDGSRQVTALDAAELDRPHAAE